MDDGPFDTFFPCSQVVNQNKHKTKDQVATKQPQNGRQKRSTFFNVFCVFCQKKTFASELIKNLKVHFFLFKFFFFLGIITRQTWAWNTLAGMGKPLLARCQNRIADG
jgi:hypothetical protein